MKPEEAIQPIYEVGDKVKIIRYGHAIWQTKMVFHDKLSFPTIIEDENTRWIDMLPEVVGQEGIVSEVGKSGYAIDGINGKHAWFNEEQMQMISKNPNR